MYKKFVCKNLASVGYYVGGMKELQLKSSENKQVIFASYSMCSEGLDIPTLNAEFLITPKTDVVQIVGRVLRAKHRFSHPIIYDFVDSHDVFQRQWLKRKAYYKKQNYKIIGTNSMEYNTDTSQWREIYKSKNDRCVKPSRAQNENEADEETPNDKFLTGVCLLKFKKI
jgi:superfamily II DNA or RNA helicase